MSHNISQYLGIALDLKGDIKSQLRAAAAIYQERTGLWPDVVIIHPSIVAEHPITKLGIKIEYAKYITPASAMIGTQYTGGMAS